MSEVLVNVIKFGFVALLWIFILICANVIRSDMFGHAVTATAPAPSAGPRTRRARKSAQPRALAVVQGRQLGLELPLGNGIDIGRAPDSTLLLDDDYCSTRHANIAQDSSGGWYVHDLGSTNGTFVNDTRISAPTSIGVEDDVRIGRTILKLVS